MDFLIFELFYLDYLIFTNICKWSIINLLNYLKQYPILKRRF